MGAEYLFRRNTVLESLRAGRRRLDRLWLQKGINQEQIAPILAAAEERQTPLQTTHRRHLAQMAGDGSHQGMVLEAGPYPYAALDDMFALAARRNERPLLLLLDLLHGPQNIGSLLRTAESVGVHGVVIQDRRAPEITPHTVVYSAGAAEHLLIAQVTNLVETIRRLKEEDVWVVGMDVDPDAYLLGQLDLDMSLAIVVGHEGEGLRRLVRQNCDFLLQLPMRGQVASLNAAAAGSILLYAAWQARGFPR